MRMYDKYHRDESVEKDSAGSYHKGFQLDQNSLLCRSTTAGWHQKTFSGNFLFCALAASFGISSKLIRRSELFTLPTDCIYWSNWSGANSNVIKVFRLSVGEEFLVTRALVSKEWYQLVHRNIADSGAFRNTQRLRRAHRCRKTSLNGHTGWREPETDTATDWWWLLAVLRRMLWNRSTRRYLTWFIARQNVIVISKYSIPVSWVLHHFIIPGSDIEPHLYSLWRNWNEPELSDRGIEQARWYYL